MKRPSLTLFFSVSLSLFLAHHAIGDMGEDLILGRLLASEEVISQTNWFGEGDEEGEFGFFATGSELEATPEILSLVRSLEYNPVRIFEYVRNNIDYVPAYGARNGALMTLLSKRGNDLDQCALLISMLQAADPSINARYAAADVVYTTAVLANILGVDSSQVVSYLRQSGIDALEPLGPGYVAIIRYWVEATINGSNRVMDPAFKTYVNSNAMNVLQISGYNRTQFMARAVSGATVTTNSIRNCNEANIRADMATFATNFVAYIRTNQPNADFERMLGGRRIIPQTFTQLPTVLPLYYDANPPVYYNSLTNNLFWHLRIQHQGIDTTLKVSEFAGKRLTIQYDGTGNAPRLRIDGVQKTQGNATTTGTTNNLTLTLLRPTSPPVTNVFKLICGQFYYIANDFGAASPAVIAKVSKQLSRDRMSGLAETSEAVRGNTLHLMGLSYFNQMQQSHALAGRLTRVAINEMYNLGLVAQESGYFIDIPAAIVAVRSVTNNPAREIAVFRSSGLFLSAAEHGMLEQMQGTNKPAASAVKLLRMNNATNKETYLAHSGNWTGASGVRTQLVNYTSAQLTQLDGHINAGRTAILPKDAAITLAQWTGVGYYIAGPSNLALTIAGNYKGGYSGLLGPVESSVVQNETTTAYVPLPPANVFRPQSEEPVDLASGDYLFENTDLALGGDEPRGLKLVRSYNSSQSYVDSRLRYGWTHNYDMRAATHSNPDAALGTRQATDAAAFAVYSLIAADLLENELNIRGWVAATIATKWVMDQLIDNAVSIQMGAKTLSFIKLPDNSYNSPPGVTASLTGSNGAFRLNERFGVRYDFNANNRISSWRDADTNIMTFSYNAQTNLTAVTNVYGQWLSFSYSGATQLTSVADSSSRSVTYGYSAGNLTSYTDPEGKVWSYTYDSNRWMRTLIDPLTQVTASNTYDAVGMVITQRNAAGFSWAFYVTPNYRSIEQDPFGGQIRYFFNKDGRQIAKEDAYSNRWSYAYDGQGRVTNEINPRSFRTVYQYDAHHNRTNVINALTNATAYTYDAQHRLVSVRDALGNTTQYGYDSEHHVTNVVDALGNSTTFTYQPNGLLQTVTGPRGEVTSYTYDSIGNPATITRTDGGTEARTWNARGDLLTLTDANSNTTTFTYDKRRLLTSERDAMNRATSNLYNNAGLLVTNIDKRGFATITTYTPTYKVASVRYPDTGVVSNFYDAADRLVAVRDPLGFTTTNQYDLAGRLTRVVNSLGHAVSNRYDQIGNLITVRDQAGNLYSNQYDAINRLTRSVDPLGNIVSNHYNVVNWLTATVDPAGKKTEFGYDAAGRVTLERRVNLDHVFEYDASGNRIAYVNPKSERIGFGYDKMNRLIAETNAISKVTRYVYDPAGNLRQKINANGQTNVFAYNVINQLTNRLSGSENVSFWYDQNGNLTNMVDGLGTTRQTFDSMNRLTQVIDPFGQVVSYQYNLAGARTQITYPDGKTQTFAYDGVYRLTNSGASSFGLSSASYGYDSRNNLTGASLPGGLSRSNSFDVASRLTAWSVAKAGSNLLARSMTRNKLGFRTNEVITAGLEVLDAPAVQAHAHDGADRITGITQSGPGATNVPSYDAAGNLTQLVYSVMGQTFATRYGYDFNNRLVGVERLRNLPNGSMVTSSVTQLEYDGAGLMLRSTENGNVRRLVRDRIDALARPLVEIGATTNAVRWYVWSNGKLLAQVESNGTIRITHADELGKVLAFTDNSGTVTDEFAYQPYGKLIARTGSTDSSFLLMGDYGVLHAGQGLYLTRHRAYNSNLARFLQTDPIGIAGGYNLYSFGEGSPSVFIDPSGQIAWWGTGLIGGGIGGVLGGAGAYYASDGDWNAVKAGFWGGAASGFMIGSGAHLVGVALGSSSISAGGALGTMTLVGGSAGVVGNTVEQVAYNGFSGASFGDAVASVNMTQQAVSGVIGVGAGLIGGGQIVANQYLQSSMRQASANLTQFGTAIRQELVHQGASPAIVNNVQAGVNQGMAQVSRTTANIVTADRVLQNVIIPTGQETLNRTLLGPRKPQM